MRRNRREREKERGERKREEERGERRQRNGVKMIRNGREGNKKRGRWRRI